MRYATIITVFIMLVAITGVTLTTTSRPVRTASDQYLTDTLKKASLAFAGARAINALVSIAQKIEAGGSLKFLGTGGSATIAPFEWLDPINDLVERFSLIMLTSCVSLGIQLFLNQLTPWFSLSILLPTGALLLILSLLLQIFGYNSGRPFYRAGFKLLLITVMLAIMVPTLALINHAVFKTFFNDTYRTASISLNYFNNNPGPAPEEGADIKESTIRLKEKAEQLRDRAETLIEHIIDLIVIFIVQTVLLPLAFLWVFVKCLLFIIGQKDNLPWESYFRPDIA
ncbi:MAG: hypothetical protein ACLFS7_09070 [Desulfosudaceae bacterium]